MKKLDQSGRTIVEILGVLVLIGIISLGMLSFYAYLIEKHHANVLTQEILQRGLDIKNQIDKRKKNIHLNKFEPHSMLGYDMTFDQVSVGIQVDDVPERLCEATAENTKDLLHVKIYTSDKKTELDECGETNLMIFYYDTEKWKKAKRTMPEDECPAGTPKGANPKTCECDTAIRYLDEDKNECVCWSGVEIEGICAKSCTTSDDCGDNEVCEEHICVKIHYHEESTTQVPVYSSGDVEYDEVTSTSKEMVVPTSTSLWYTTFRSLYPTTNTSYETTSTLNSTTSTPYETTSTLNSTTSTSYETTSTLNSTTSTSYETTSTLNSTTSTSYKTTSTLNSTTSTLYETTSRICSNEKPYYKSNTDTCVECLNDNHCNNEEVCSYNNCVCQMTKNSCSQTDFNPAQCMCCPSTAPVYDAISGTCKTCVEMHPEWAETGSGYDVTTRQCWAYCKAQSAGVVMMVDRSQSTLENYVYNDKLKWYSALSNIIPEVLSQLKIPNKIKSTIYIHDGGADYGGVRYEEGARIMLPYGYNGLGEIYSAIKRIKANIWNVSGTSFYNATVHTINHICLGSNDKLIVMMWSDGVLEYDSLVGIHNLKYYCPNAKFYYIGPNSADFSAYYDKFYPIHSLPEDYVDSLNNFIRQEGCIHR